MVNKTRCMRNNNPLNIIKGSSWQGMAEEQPDARFVKFKSPKWGFRAAFIILHKYFNVYKIRTIKDIIAKWCPDYTQKRYVTYVSMETGIKPDEVLAFRLEDLEPVMRAMARYEGYNVNNIIIREEINNGWKLYRGEELEKHTGDSTNNS